MPKSSENLWKFWEELGNLREFPKTSETLQTRFLWNLWKTSETVQKCFPDVFMSFLNFQKIFGSVRKSSEIFGKLRKRFKSNFEMFLWFFKIFGKLRKSSKVFGNLRKFSGRHRNVHNGSQELKNFGAGFWEVIKWTNCCAQVMTEK